MALNAETFRLLRSQQAGINAAIGGLDRGMQVAWARIWADLDAGSWGALTRRQRRNLEAALATQLGQQVEKIASEVARTAKQVADQAWDHSQAMASAQTPIQLAFNRPDPQAVEAMRKRTTQQIESRAHKLGADLRDNLGRELRRAPAEGLHPEKVAQATARQSDALEVLESGGFARLLNIARTEVLDAYRTSAMQTQLANSDVLDSWQWIAKLSSRTCRSCWSMHGRKFALEIPGPHDHPQGRCARVPITKTWKELGFDGIEETGVITELDAAKAFGKLTEAQQLAILGEKGFAGWQAGGYPMGAWAQLVERPGWRPYYVASSA